MIGKKTVAEIKAQLGLGPPPSGKAAKMAAREEKSPAEVMKDLEALCAALERQVKKVQKPKKRSPRKRPARVS